MRPRNEKFCSKYKQELYRIALIDMLDEVHLIVKLAQEINWKKFDSEFDKHYSERRGRPAISTRIIFGLHYLKHDFNVSDENVVERFKENNYWQYFCGNTFFERESPCVPTALVELNKRIGQAGLEMMLQETLAVAMELGFLQIRDRREVIVDTRGQEKNSSRSIWAGWHEMFVGICPKTVKN